MARISYKCRFPLTIIQHAVWLYFCLTLSLETHAASGTLYMQHISAS